jgi:O-antigen ligase
MNANFLSSRLMKISTWFTVSFILGSIPSLVHLDQNDFLLTSGQLIIAYSIIFLLTQLNHQAIVSLKLRITSYYFFISLLTILVGVGWLDWEYEQDYRIQLFYLNPNLLGASISLLATITLLLEKNLSQLFTLLFAVLAILQTGSRTALLVFIISVVIWVIFNRGARIQTILTLGLIVLVPFALGLFSKNYVASVEHMTNSQNLLKDSNNFLATYWLPYIYAHNVIVSSKVTKAPIADYRADRITAQSGDKTTLLIYQNFGVGEVDKPYIGSIYLRADTPQKIVLSTNLSQVSCDVSSEWQRCMTSPGYVRERTGVQLRLEAGQYNQAVDIYVWGAQLEIGEHVSDLAIKYQPPALYFIFKRLEWGGVGFGVDNARSQSMQKAWAYFLTSPIIGVGNRNLNFDISRADETTLRLEHSHNLYLQLLASKGILGLLAGILPIFGILTFTWKTNYPTVLPLLVSVILLNLFDFTYYSAGIYYPFWITLGLMLQKDKV